MNIVQNLMGRLRPLVGLKAWDYCVLWKLSEDQRFIEWMDCCCGGSDENGEEVGFHCRDVFIQHPLTKSCQLLAQLPSSMPLDSGMHAQTLMSNQPNWINFSNSSDSNSVEETIGTRVLVPVPGGLIELFISKQAVQEDQNVIDFITTQCNISMEQQETMINSSTTYPNPNPNPTTQPISPATSLETNLSLPYDITADRIRLNGNNNNNSNSPMNFFQQFGNDDVILEMDGLEKSMNMQFVDPNLCNKEHQGNDKDSVKLENSNSNNNNGRSDLISDCSDQIDDDEDDAKYRRRTGKGPQSKNLMAERKRRKKLNDRLYALRALVPKISKLDRAAIIGDAIDFVKELQKQEKELKEELESQSEVDEMGNPQSTTTINVRSELNPTQIIVNNNAIIGSKREHDHLGVEPGLVASKQQNQEPELISDDKTQHLQQQMEPQVEVAQIGGNEFFVKVFCEHKPGGFTRLMEALDSLGLEVTNANVTSFRSLVSNVFKVEKKDSEMVQADEVKESLLELTRNPFRGWKEMTRTKENNINIEFQHPHQQQQQHQFHNIMNSHPHQHHHQHHLHIHQFS